MTYRLNNRGGECLGGNIGDVVTIAEVQDIFESIMGESMDDIGVYPDGLYLLRADGERERIAEVVDA